MPNKATAKDGVVFKQEPSKDDIERLQIQVFGPVNSGKTSIMLQIAHFLRSKGHDVVMVESDYIPSAAMLKYYEVNKRGKLNSDKLVKRKLLLSQQQRSR